MNILYRILFAFLYLLSLLPLRLLYLLSDILFFPLFYVVKYRRKVVENSWQNASRKRQFGKDWLSNGSSIISSVIM